MYWNCHTYYSFKYGTLSPERLLNQAAKCGVSKLAFTDINNTSATVDMLRRASKVGIKAVPGVEFRNGNHLCFVALARNNEGFEEINRFLSYFLHAEKAFPESAPDFKNVIVIYPLDFQHKRKLKAFEYWGVKSAQLSLLRYYSGNFEISKLLAWMPITFETRRDFNAHRLLRAVDANCLLTQLPGDSVAAPDEVMRDFENASGIFKGFESLLLNSEDLLDGCHVDLELGVPKNKLQITGSMESDFVKLKKLAVEGAKYRYGESFSSVLPRLESELDIIQKKQFVAYFLINHGIVEYARSRGFFYVGRGSGANSLVAYCLRITDVDPIELDLYFERFINLYRENPPDFDLDFSWKDRDEIYKYLFETYGTEHVCLLATFSTMQARSAIRELGKVFGLPKGDIEQLIYCYDKKLPAPDSIGEWVFKYAEYLHDFPLHLSIHAGGVLISEKPVYCYTATEIPPKGYPISQFSMHESEDLGLYKFDILSQRGLGHIKDAVELVKKNKGDDVDIQAISKFKKDEKIKEHLRTGKTIGCFYVESPAMRMLLSKLRADTYTGLVAASSIIRPGVARSGMMQEYIRRHRQPELREKINPIMADIMPETYGVMVYQEDVIKVAHRFAGLGLAEADVLRRGMSGKFRSRDEFQRVKDKFFENCRKIGHSDRLAADIWFQIESFAGYSFSKGHSASYAVESYQSLYLKAYYPLEFITAVINNFGGFYRTEFYIHEARMSGATVEGPCINKSERLATITGTVIYLGFNLVSGLEDKTIHSILETRAMVGKFESLGHFLTSCKVGFEQTLLLIRVGAFRFSTQSKAEMLWEAHFYFRRNATANVVGSGLFDATPVRKFDFPTLEIDTMQDARDHLELLGFSLCPAFDLVKEMPRNTILAREIKNFHQRQIRIVGQLVTYKPTQTIKGERMSFGTFIDEEGLWIDTVHFPPVHKKYSYAMPGCYLIEGKVMEEFDFYTIEVNKITRLETKI
jgi:DNA polymerase-3 subunit alpha